MSRHNLVRGPIILELNRPSRGATGAGPSVWGDVNLTARFRHGGRSFRYEPELYALPSGEADLVGYLVSREASSLEIGRFPVEVRLPGNFERVSRVPSLRREPRFGVSPPGTACLEREGVYIAKEERTVAAPLSSEALGPPLIYL